MTPPSRHDSLLALFRHHTGGNTIYKPKLIEAKVPYQTSRIQNYQMTGRRG